MSDFRAERREAIGTIASDGGDVGVSHWFGDVSGGRVDRPDVARKRWVDRAARAWECRLG